MNQAKILVIDDDFQIRKFLKKILVASGYTPLLAETGQEGALI